MKTVYYIGNFSMPDFNATGKRVFANCKIFKTLGYDVVCIGASKNIKNECFLEFEGIKCYNSPFPSFKQMLNYNKIYKNIVNILKKEKAFESEENIIVLCGAIGFSILNRKLIKLAKKNNLKVISDCMDWLVINSKNIIFKLIKSFDDFYQKRFINNSVDGVIAISSYLANYYSKKVKTIIIPPLSVETFPINMKKGIIHLFYCGIPFKIGSKNIKRTYLKDRIDVIIKSLSKISKDCNFKFSIIGISKEDYLLALPDDKDIISRLGDKICFCGHIKNDKVYDKVKNMDFMILIRDINRTSTAGFPSKVSESFNYNIPVITNDTSDLSKYIFDNKNGFLINYDGENIDIKLLKRILNFNKTEITRMKEYIKSEAIFDYKNYVEKLKTFLSEL